MACFHININLILLKVSQNAILYGGKKCQLPIFTLGHHQICYFNYVFYYFIDFVPFYCEFVYIIKTFSKNTYILI